ncbi:MAG TPA: endonuclease MutS2 [Bryobacteraceae bacterium]|nr:endonuclease MutS2 [Bryobacteraceae bacterium]
MKHTSAVLLEFDALKELLARYLSGPLGRAELEKLAPSTARVELEQALAELAEATEYSRLQQGLPLNGLVDSTVAVQKLRIEGAGLEAKEIGDLTAFLDRATEVRLLLLAEARRFPKLAARAEGLGDFRGLLREVAGKVLPNGTVADHASVALNRLRRDIARQQRNIHESLEKFLRSHREDGILQEEYVAIRNDRFVVPIIAGQRRKVDGVIHGASSSGQTLFVEPLDTIDLNNELVRLTEEEWREVHRILREITGKLREHADAIRSTLRTISELDLLFAKAAFALAFDCVIPRFSPEQARRIHLKQARHPLLEDVLRKQKKRVVPVSLTLDQSTRILLISGPNTGGKTVAMKTVGLLALMAQAALPVPAAEAEFPIFDQVLADIGDQQSIEQSLSTFSAHITCNREMVAEATPDSLVLLDELGRATDPEEGGALGVAILDNFRNLHTFTLASTHLLALKVYGANTATVLNGSMGFDDATLQPTYELRLGAPGKSAGLDIAARLGLPESLIHRARAAMSTTERDIARFLSELHQKIAGAAAMEEQLRQKIQDFTLREQTLQREWEKRESARVREIERRADELVARFESQAKETIESILQTAEQRKSAEQAFRKVAKTKREFQNELETNVLATGPAPSQAAKLRLEEGSRVVLKGIRQPARVRKISGDSIEVDAGLMKMRVSMDDIQEVLPASGETAKLPKNVTFQSGPRWDVPYQEINVIGHRAEEACDEVEKFLDHAAMASVMRVRIVHGHGMGVLKKAIAGLLSSSPHVEKFYPASPNEGGTGATIAELKAN